MPDNRIRILLVDDHPMMIKGLAATLEPEPDMLVVGSASTGADALLRFRETRPDVTIMDVTLRAEMNGIEAVKAIRREFLDARIIMLTVHREEDKIFRALQAGAATYLLKETLGDRLVTTIKEVHEGTQTIPPEIGRKLADRVGHAAPTGRELEVLRLMAEGLRNKEIANRLGIGEQTVLTHIKSVFGKLGVSDRTRAVTVAIERGFLDINS